MNQRQKEILQAQLDSEKAVLKKLEQNYQDALDEINNKIELLMARQDADMQHVIYQVEYQKALKTQVQAILETLQANEFETVSEYLTQSYEDGFIGTMYDLQGQGIPLVFPIDQKAVVEAIQQDTKLSESLYTAMGHDITDLKKKINGEISRGISSGQMYNEIARNVSNWARIPKNNAMRIARTEAHRIQCKAASDAQYRAKEKGADVVKQWDSSLDGRTRKNHRKLDGQIRELDEPFEVDGHKAMFPGAFGRPEEDINCRCAILQRARWALGNNYTKWSEDAEVVIDDDGTTQFTIIEADNYKEFQKKYKQASERVREGAQKMNDKGTSLEKAQDMQFIPAKTIEEAQEKAKEYIGDGYSKTFKNTADYKGISLDNANEINRTLEELYEKYDIPKINGIKVISPTSAQGKKVFSSADAVAAYNPVEKGIFLNKDVLKNTDALAKYNKQSEEAWDLVMQNIDKLTGSQKELALMYKNAGRSLVGDGSVHDYIIHEMGHHIQWNVLDAKTNNAMGSNMAKYAPKLSGYANASKGEYIAESFAAYTKGELEKLDPDFIEFMKNKKPLEKAGKSSTVLFKGVSTVDEAEKYAEQFVSSFKNKYSGNISYKSIDVEYANKVNKVLTDTFSRYDCGTLNNIQAINFKDKRFKDSTASAAYDWGNGTLYYNGRYFKNAKALEAHKKEADDLLKKVLDNADDLLNKPDLSEWQKKHLKTLVNTGRECVAQSYDFTEATITHEMGHFLDDKVFKLQLVQNNDFLAKSMEKYAGNISGYAVSSKQEYVAESYVAYCFGETDILDPELVKIFKGAEK